MDTMLNRPAAMPPRWVRPVAVLALLWNLLGCAAFFADLMMGPADVAQLPPEQQAMYAARPVWAVAATAVGVFGGAIGSFGVLLGRRWAWPLLLASLLGVIVQDIAMFVIFGAIHAAAPVAMALQGVVLLVAIGLAWLARRGVQAGWLR